MLEKRLQLLLDKERYRRLAERARATNKSIGALVRDAIDIAYPERSNRRAAALRRILDAPRIHITRDELRRELDEIRSGRV